jgi:hypothetical protein
LQRLQKRERERERERERSFNIQELLHCKYKCHETKLMHPFSSSSSRAFQRDSKHDLNEASHGSHKYKNKTNKQPSFIDR